MKPSPLYHGVCYYPELWPAADLERDIAEMRKLGINMVRMGEFIWSLIEPEPGQISLDYFVGVLDRLHAAGIDVVWCTPTPTPPIWLTHGHPDRCLVDGDGRVMSHGSRQHASYEHPAVRSACHRIVEACGRALGNHPAIVAWQIDNEFKCHVAEDFNLHAIIAWRAWLAERYGTIEKLNQAWGTDIWSETYQRFDQVPAPVATPFMHNASLSTAWRRFARERIAEFMDEQVEILRRHTTRPITHNFGLGFAIDFERMGQNLDFASFDNYPPSDRWSDLVLDHDMYRGAKPGQSHWLMETSVAHNGWFGAHEPVHPRGYLAAEAVVGFALGSRAMCYWLWRQQRAGCEMPHSAVMSAWFKPGIGYAEVQSVEVIRRALEPLILSTTPASAAVGLTWSDRGRVMLEVEPLGAKAGEHEVDYVSTIKDWHRHLCDTGVHRAVVFEEAGLDGYRVLFTPAMACVDSDFLAKVSAWVKAGGTWICGPLTGTRTAEHNVPTDVGLGQALEELAGVELIFSWPITGSGTMGGCDAGEFPLVGWCGALRVVDGQTQALGTLRCDTAADGLFWWTERAVGQGKVVMLTAEVDGETKSRWMQSFIRRYVESVFVIGAPSAEVGTLLCPRRDVMGETVWVAVNLDGGKGVVTLPAAMADALTGEILVEGPMQLGRYGWRTLRFQ